MNMSKRRQSRGDVLRQTVHHSWIIYASYFSNTFWQLEAMKHLAAYSNTYSEIFYDGSKKLEAKTIF